MIPEDKWSDRAAKTSFWSLNIGLSWMLFATLFPLGVLQLYAAVNQGYFYARSLQFEGIASNVLLGWLRLPGDVLFIAGGVLPIIFLCWRAVRYMPPQVAIQEPGALLFDDTPTVGTTQSA